MSRSTSSVFRTVSIFACILLSAALAHAQYRTSIQGSVTDTSGAVIPGANLTLTNPATGEQQVRVSNDAGVYNFNALPAAPFRLEVSKDGFQTKVIDNLHLIPEQANAVNVQLEVGTASQTVTVNAETEPLLQSETASINGVVTDNQIQHMPSFGRDVFQLIQLAPGVFGDGSQGSGGNSQRVCPEHRAPVAPAVTPVFLLQKTVLRLSPLASNMKTTVIRLTVSAPPARSGGNHNHYALGRFR